MDVKKSIEIIQNAFKHFLIDSDESTFKKQVSSSLTAITEPRHTRYTIEIVESDYHAREAFFGMRVFPGSQQAERVCRSIVQDEITTLRQMLVHWSTITDWVIEMDDRLFDRTHISFSPEELTAMLLHEIGHVKYSEKPAEIFFRAYKECDIRLRESDRAAAKMLYTLYMIPLTISCGIRNWSITSADMREEIFADQSVAKLGYGEYLISAYTKIIKVYGSSGYQSEDQAFQEVSRTMDTCNACIADLRTRRTKLKDELYSTGVSHKSHYIRDLVNGLMSKLGVARKDKYEGSVVVESLNPYFDQEDFFTKNDLIFDEKVFGALENAMISLKQSAESQIAQEAFGFGKRKKDDLIPSQLEVDLINVEVDRISNHADRRYVLDLIYAEEEKITHFLEICKYDKSMEQKYGNRMCSMLRELNDCRQKVLAKRSFDKQYKLFVRYPNGYEG